MEIMAYWWILIYIINIIKTACAYQCAMDISELTCSGINSDQLSQKVSATFNKFDVVSLNITNGIVSTVSKGTFEDFTSLQHVYITNCQVSNLEDNAFSHSTDLKILYLNNNLLTKFNVRSVSRENGITDLDLSYNLLRDISDFNISDFPKLSVLNLASNFLSYLPVNLLEKLNEQNQFYLVADNNPWNCSDPSWSDYLTDNLANAFCVNNTFNYTRNVYTESSTSISETTIDQTLYLENITIENNENIVTLQPFVMQYFENNITENKNITTAIPGEQESQPCEKLNCEKCSFYFCLYWFLGGIWVGIILGNIVKIKNLICTKPITYSDQFTQCETYISDQYMVSGFRLDLYKKSTPEQGKSKNQQARVST